jgi:hypothetical protein
MNEEIKQLLLNDISKIKRLPTKDDIKTDRPCALFSFDNAWSVDGVSGKESDLSRLEMFSKILKHITPKRAIKFIMYFDDYTKDIDNHDAASLCFAKMSGQNFITIPNIHILCGYLDSLYKEVADSDIPFDQKKNVSFFAAGPNCNFTDPRSRYTFRNYNPNRHVVLITNHPSLRIPINLQIQAKYLINIDGHGLCYDRLYWQMKSNSVPIYIEPNMNVKQIPDVLFKPDVNYIKCSVTDWENVFDSLNTEDGQKKCLDIITNNTKMINSLFDSTTQAWSLQTLQFILDNMPGA